MHPRIYLGPRPIPELVKAVETGGGDLVESVSEAEAIIWYGGSPSEFGEVDHDGIRWVQLQSAGVEGWFEAEAFSSGKTFTGATGSYAESVAEHSLALMLAGLRQLHVLARQQSWTRVQAGTLFDTTVGIIGSGGIGQELIRLLEPFRARVLAITRSGRTVPGATVSTTPDQLDEVLGESHVVVIGAPATPDTRHLIGRRELDLMRQDAVLVNIARGALIDTDALVEALRDGAVGAACLDVTDPEPLPDGHPLWSEPRALITPHSANPEHLLLPKLVDRVRENVRRFAAGEPLLGVIDVGRGY